jgi:putative spermidine/putrescine transport system substrate-binding protein
MARATSGGNRRDNGGMHRALGLLCLVAVLAGACGGGPVLSGAPRAVGTGDGLLDLVAWAGTVEDGSNDPRLDWVHPFERSTGCMVSVRYATSAEEMVGLMRQRGAFDGGLVSSDVAGRLVLGGDVAPLDPKLLPGLPALMPALRPPFEGPGGALYGVPLEYGPNLLLYNSSVIRRPPASWRIVWDRGSPYKGRVIAYGASIALADAALYLRAHDRALGITDPFELTPEQLKAATGLLEDQTELTHKEWTQFSEELIGFAGGAILVGVGRPIVLDLGSRVPVRGVVPREGVTGWVDGWMVSSHAAHPNCMYRWMQWTTNASVQAQVAQWNGAAPANPAACPLLRRAVGSAADTIRYGRCGDAGFLRSMALWRTPSSDCARGRASCEDYHAWIRAWASVDEG